MLASLNSDKDFALLKYAVKAAGEIAMSYFDKSPKSHSKQDGSPVSEADLAVNEFLKEQLTHDRPDYGWLSEENDRNNNLLEKNKVWTIDPIDGTRAFLRKQSDWTISCALLIGNIPTYAAIYNPVKNEFYDAVLGHGARLNNQIINVSQRHEIARSNIIISKKACSLFHKKNRLENTNQKWASSVAYRMCLLSSGKADAVFVRSGAYDWDLAAAHLIVRESGGILTNFSGQHPTFNNDSLRHGNILASNEKIHNKLLKLCNGIEF